MHRDNALAISDLESETQIMISLRHRSILRVLGVGKTGGLSVEPVSNCHLAWVLTGATPTRPARPLRGPRALAAYLLRSAAYRRTRSPRRYTVGILRSLTSEIIVNELPPLHPAGRFSCSRSSTPSS